HFGGDGEARGNGNPDLAHLGEVGPLAAKQFLLLTVAVGRLAAKEIHVLLAHNRSSGKGNVNTHRVAAVRKCFRILTDLQRGWPIVRGERTETECGTEPARRYT